MFLMGYEESGLSKCHVCIHTSNILHSDAELKSQGVYAQDFPLKVAPGKSTGNPYCKKEDALQSRRQFEGKGKCLLQSRSLPMHNNKKRSCRRLSDILGVLPLPGKAVMVQF